jgi:hypothetical protein
MNFELISKLQYMWRKHLILWVEYETITVNEFQKNIEFQINNWFHKCGIRIINDYKKNLHSTQVYNKKTSNFMEIGSWK